MYTNGRVALYNYGGMISGELLHVPTTPGGKPSSAYMDAMIGSWTDTPLSCKFFSADNVQVLQDGLREGVKKRSKGQYLIGEQVKSAPQIYNIGLEVIPTAYILLDGNMEIVKNTIKGEQILGSVDKNAVFGEMAIIDNSPRSASARASSKCKVQEVDHNAFLQYVSNYFHFYSTNVFISNYFFQMTKIVIFKSMNCSF